MKQINIFLITAYFTWATKKNNAVERGRWAQNKNVMNTLTMAGFNMSRVVETECKANQGIVDTNTGFKNSFILFSAKNANINSLAPRQAMNIKGYTANKNAMKKNLAEFGNSLAGIVFAYADEKEMTTLKESMRFMLSGLQKAKDDDLISNCRNIYTLVIQTQLIWLTTELPLWYSPIL